MQQHQHLFRTFALVLAIALSFRYLLWRGIYTLTYSDVLSMVAVWLLFGAEIYAGITSVLGAIVNAFPLSRPLLTLKGTDPATLPTVDVMIPSYNEDADILEVTIRAAKMLDYPKDKLRVIFLMMVVPTKNKFYKPCCIGYGQTQARRASAALPKARNTLSHKSTKRICESG